MSQTLIDDIANLVIGHETKALPLNDLNELKIKFPAWRTLLEGLSTQQLVQSEIQRCFISPSPETFFLVSQVLYYLGATRTNSVSELLKIYDCLPANDVFPKISPTNDIQWDPISKSLKVLKVNFQQVFKAIFVLTQGLHQVDAAIIVNTLKTMSETIFRATAQELRAVSFPNNSKFRGDNFIISVLYLYVTRYSLPNEYFLANSDHVKYMIEALGFNNYSAIDGHRYLDIAMPANGRISPYGQFKSTAGI